MRGYQYKTIFAKRYVPNSSEGFFVIEKAKNTMLWTYLIEDPNERNYWNF